MGVNASAMDVAIAANVTISIPQCLHPVTVVKVNYIFFNILIQFLVIVVAFSLNCLGLMPVMRLNMREKC